MDVLSVAAFQVENSFRENKMLSGVWKKKLNILLHIIFQDSKISQTYLRHVC